MRSLIFSIILLFGILLYVQARSLENMDPDSSLSEKYFIKSPSYSDLLTFLGYRRTNIHKNDNDDNNNQNIDDEMVRRKERLSSTNRRFFLFDGKRPSRKGRPPNSYGKQSHWDAFFG